jgi:hypothetical protein
LTGRSSRGTFQTAASRGVHKPTQGLQVRPAALGFFLPPQKAILVTRATVFIDGANLYRGLSSIGVRAREIDTTKVARKLVQDTSYPVTETSAQPSKWHEHFKRR